MRISDVKMGVEDQRRKTNFVVPIYLLFLLSLKIYKEKKYN